MSLVTRCPACTTTFKVVRDQLRISDGWVRCGRCSEVFDATLDLMDTESGVPVPPHSFISPKPPPLDDARSSVPPEPSSAPMGDGDRGVTSAAHPFEALQSDLRSFGQQEPVAPAAVPSPSALPMSWPAAGLLELPAAAPTPAPTLPAPAPAASSVPLALPEPSTARVALRPEGESAPAPAVPAWRRIQVAPAPPLIASQEVEGVVADEPWPMRRASALQDAAPPPASTSAIDAAVDAQLQKALRRARVQALREERERQAPNDANLAPERDDTARDEPTSPSASVLRQASTDGAAAAKAAEVDAAPSTDTLLDSTLYSAEFLVSQPAVLEAPARRRGRAWLFGLLALLAGVLLLAQVLRHDRNAWAASQPALRPAIEALCEFTACVVSAPRRIDAVRIDGSSFTPSRQGERYELMFTLRNAAPTPVAMPSIELSLLDGNERPVMRRVFHPADFGAPAQMGPRAEQMAQLHLSVQVPPEQRAPSVMGYSMLAFYP